MIPEMHKEDTREMEELIEILEDLNPDVDYRTCTDIMTGGYLTSFDFVVLISQISQVFNVRIPVGNIRPEQFDSVEMIMKLIEKLWEEGC